MSRGTACGRCWTSALPQGLSLALSYTVLGEFCTSYIFNRKKCTRWEGCAASAALCLFLDKNKICSFAVVAIGNKYSQSMLKLKPCECTGSAVTLAGAALK